QGALGGGLGAVLALGGVRWAGAAGARGRCAPHSTSQLCSGCGRLVGKSLSVRTQSCPHCGLVLDRDHNAAVVFQEAGLAHATQQGIWDPSTQRVIPKQGIGSSTVGHTGTDRVWTAGLRGIVLTHTWLDHSSGVSARLSLTELSRHLPRRPSR